MEGRRLMKKAEDLSDQIDWIEVSWGPEKFSPISFHSFDVGPFTARAKLRPGDTVAQTIARLTEELAKLGAEQFERELVAYCKRVGKSADEVRSTARVNDRG